MIDSSERLTQEQEHFARVMFKNRILESNGQRYEDLFVAVMVRRDSRFRPVKPQGSRGDEGNDGYIPEDGRYFQVYAPEDPKTRVDAAAKKARDDFSKLQKHWEATATIVDFRFVFNDKYQGSYPTVEHAMADIKREHGLEIAKPFLAKDLEREFMELPPSDKHALLGGVIPRPQYIEDIDYAALTEILQHLVDNQSPIPSEGLPAVPDYTKKIQFNDIDQAGSLLRVGNFQNAAVDQFFDQHGEFTRTDIRNRLAQSYRSAIEANTGETAADTPPGDRTFFRLLSEITPEAGRQVQDAAIVLIAYFFEKCDVFEDPNG